MLEKAALDGRKLATVRCRYIVTFTLIMNHGIGTLSTLAHKARRDFENGRIDTGVLEGLYAAYNPLQDLGSFIEASQHIFPSLNCGLASLYLRYLLGTGQLMRVRYGSHNHTVLQVDDETIMDITADQYGGPTIYIGPLASPYSPG